MQNVFSFLQDSTMKYPARTCIIDQCGSLTYSQVYRRAAGLAELLKGFNIRQGDRILIYLDNSPEYVAAFFSVLAINAIAVPINKNTSPETFQYIVNDTSPKVLITNEVFYHKIADKIGLNGCICLCIDRALQEISLSDCRYTSLPSTDTAPAHADPSDGSLPALILYTSGTTRLPKGVVLTHKNLIANTGSILQYLRLTPEDSVLATISFSYSYGNSVLLTHIRAGAAIIIENRISYPMIILEQLPKSRATGYSTVGSHISVLLKQGGLKAEHFESLRYITFAGESTSSGDIVKLSRLAPHIRIFVMYGQTEATARLSYLEPSMLAEKAGSVGRGIPGVTLRVVTEDGRDAFPGEIGEVVAAGENIMRGYWNNEAETRAAIRDGWLHTGDLAEMDADGYIYIKGRKDDIIKHLGHRISPAEIEAVINSCDGVCESAVVGVDGSEGKQIKAYVVLAGQHADKEGIASYVRQHLPPVKRPHTIEYVGELPKTVNGKIIRSILRK